MDRHRVFLLDLFNNIHDVHRIRTIIRDKGCVGAIRINIDQQDSGNPFGEFVSELLTVRH